MEIQKIVSDSGIRPADIEKMTGGEIRLPQASVMIKKALAGGAGLSATTRWFLFLAAQAHSISQSIMAAGSSELLEGESLIERVTPAVESIYESKMRVKEAVKKSPSTPPKDTKKSVTKPKKNKEKPITTLSGMGYINALEAAVEKEVQSNPFKYPEPPLAWRTGDSWSGEGRFFKTGPARHPVTGMVVNCHKFSIREGDTSIGLAAIPDKNGEFSWNGAVFSVSGFTKV